MAKVSPTLHPDLNGIVLAGGQSVRMGRDKAGLVWSDGQTFLDRAVALLEASGCRQVIVSGERPDHDHVPDRCPDRGPLGGIASVLEARPELSGRLLIVPVDMPQLGPDELKFLIEAGADRAGAVFAGTPLPMVLEADDNTRSVVTKLIDSGRLMLKGLIEQLDMAVIEPHVSIDLANINSPADLERSEKEKPRKTRKKRKRNQGHLQDEC